MSSPQNKHNLGTEIEVLRKYRKRVTQTELLMLYNLLESTLEKIDRHLREHESNASILTKSEVNE